MLKNITKEIAVLMLMLGILTSFVNADIPDAPGPYIGATLLDDNTTVRLNFLDNSDNEDGFILTGDCLSSPMILPENNETANSEVYVNIPNLDCNQTCCFTVVAYHNDENSTPSDTRCFNMHSTLGVDCPCPGCGETPKKPGPYIGVTDVNCTAVRFNFLDNSDNEDGFLLFDRTGEINVTIPANNTPASSQTYVTVDGLDCNKTYFVTVIAFNSAGNSEPSNERSFNMESTFGVTCPCDCDCDEDVPEAPGPYIGVTGINDTTVRVNFLDNSDNEDGFLLTDRTGDINVTIPEHNASAPSQVYATVGGLTCDRMYFIKVLAFNSTGNSDTSDEKAFRIQTSFGIPCD